MKINFSALLITTGCFFAFVGVVVGASAYPLFGLLVLGFLFLCMFYLSYKLVLEIME